MTTPEEFPLTSGEYVERRVETVWVWPQDENTPPDGFLSQDDGTTAVKVDGGQVERDDSGSAGVLPRGGALVSRADGLFKTIYNAAEARRYLRTHVATDSDAELEQF